MEQWDILEKPLQNKELVNHSLQESKKEILQNIH